MHILMLLGDLIQSQRIDTTKRKARYLYFRIRELLNLLIRSHALIYIIDGKASVGKDDVIAAMRELHICSVFKFRKRNPKRCKIVISRIYRYYGYQQRKTQTLFDKALSG
jgi:hypothetical protein